MVFGSAKKELFFDKRTIKVCVSCSWRCPETCEPSTAHNVTVSVIPKATYEVRWRAYDGRRVSSKPFKGLRLKDDKREGDG